MKLFDRRVYVDSLTQLATTYNEMRDSGILISNSKPIEGYNIPRTEEGYDFPTNFVVDLERLERYGLIHRFTRAIKAGERFTRKHQLRITGWGRGYYQRNLSLVPVLQTLNARMESFFDKRITGAKRTYLDYFGLLDEAEHDRTVEPEAEKKRKELPIRVG